MSEAKKIFSFTIPEESIEELKLVAKVYMDEKLGLNNMNGITTKVAILCKIWYNT